MEKNIKNNQAILYSGNVHIRYKSGTNLKHINKHNEGTIELFTAITLVLGDRPNDARYFIPKYLKGIDTQTEGSPEDCFINNAVVQDKKYYHNSMLSDGTENDTIRYMFNIPMSNIISGKKITKLQLINERGLICASIDLTEDEYIDTNVAASLLIYWDLKFADSGTELTE
jgi:hypothetical protein